MLLNFIPEVALKIFGKSSYHLDS